MKRVITFVKKKNKTLLEQAVELIFIFVPIIFLVRTFGFGLYQVPTGSMETTLLVGERFFADKFTVWFTEIKHGDIISFNDPNFNYSKNGFVRFMQNYLWIPGGATPSNWTKRVIAVPGDEIKGVMEDGKPVVYLKKKGEAEFVKLDEPYKNQFPLVYVYDSNSSRALRPEAYDPEFSYADQPFYKMTAKSVELGALWAKKYGLPSIEYPNTPLIDRNPRNPENYGKNLDVYEHKMGDNEYWVMGDNRLGSYDSRGWGKLKGSFIHGRIVYRIFSLIPGNDWLVLDIVKHPVDFFNRVRWTRCLEPVR